MLSSRLIDAARWLLLGTLIYAPWAYGCTRQSTLWGLDMLLSGVLGLWIISLLCAARARSRRAWRLPAPLWGAVGLLLVLGWGMVVNASALFDPTHLVYISCHARFASLPGSVDKALSLDWMWRATSLLGMILFVASEIAPEPRWLLRLWWTLGLAGGSIALLGLLQKATGAEMIFWQPPKPIVAERVKTFFGPYYYHANAAAFFDLVLPATLGLLMRAFSRRQVNSFERTLWICGVVTLLVAIAANTSKAGHVLAAGLLLAVLVGPARPMLGNAWRNGERRNFFLVAALLILVAGAVLQAGNLHLVGQRWGGLSVQLAHEGRFLAFRVGLDAAPHVGWCGFGPGTFPVIFPYFTAKYGDALFGVWPALHDDYLQTLMEWGWLGALLWSVVFFGGIGTAIWQFRRYKHTWQPRQRLFLPLILFGLAATALHAGFDFPLQIGSVQLYVAAGLGICWGCGAWTASKLMTQPANES
ncbi:MAG: hypothetical protein JO295_06655 [Verrucomicrobia bacterium]|nr:hypothetical protein [Verrucomicrobiota bacterium]